MKLILVQLSPVYLGIKNGHISTWQRKLLVCKSRCMWEKNFMAKSLQSLFFYNCQILSIVQYLVVSLSQNGCIILILSIYLSQVSCLYFKYHRLLNSGCSFSGDLSLHAIRSQSQLGSMIVMLLIIDFQEIQDGSSECYCST